MPSLGSPSHSESGRNSEIDVRDKKDVYEYYTFTNCSHTTAEVLAANCHQKPATQNGSLFRCVLARSNKGFWGICFTGLITNHRSVWHCHQWLVTSL